MDQPVQEHVLVIANGEPPSRALARRLARETGFVVAADGGANTARRYGIHADLIIGDLDSISPGTKRHFASSTLLKVTRQDNTDLEKALDFLSAHGTRKATIVGITGNRIDFTLGNLAVLWNYTAFLSLVVVGDGWYIVPVGREQQHRAKVGTTVSLIPFGACEGITLRGLRYPLNNADMKIGEIGVSNVVESSPFTVRVKKGKMMMVVFSAAPRESGSLPDKQT